MIKKILRTLPFLLFFASPLQAGLQSDINRACCILAECPIPSCVLDKACGVVVMSVVKGGFIFSGEVGSGLVVARLDKGWSAPSSVGTAGVGWGLQAGGKVTDFVLVLNTQAALNAFMGGGGVTLGGSLGIAAGPIGGTADAGVMLPPAAIYAYGKSKGIFAGVSLEGTIITSRSGVNRNFYGGHYRACDILSGQVPPPKCADCLYENLK